MFLRRSRLVTTLPPNKKKAPSLEQNLTKKNESSPTVSKLPTALNFFVITFMTSIARTVRAYSALYEHTPHCNRAYTVL